MYDISKVDTDLRHRPASWARRRKMEYVLIAVNGTKLVEFDATDPTTARNHIVTMYRNRNISCCRNELTGIQSLAGAKLLRRDGHELSAIEKYC